MGVHGLTRRGMIGGLAAGGAGLALVAARKTGLESPTRLRFTGYTQHQAWAPAIGIASYRLSFLGSPPGLSDPDWRALADAAHADCLRRLDEAGLAPLPAARLRPAIRQGGSRLVPGNRSTGVLGAGRQAYVALGAREAPLLRDIDSPAINPLRPFAGLAGASAALGALLIVPAPVIAWSKGTPGFTLTAASRVLLMTPFEGGGSTVGGMMLLADPHRGADQRMLAASLAAFNAALVRELAAARVASA
jgi:hypothetical protein